MAHTAVKVRHQTKGLVRRIDWSLGGLPAYSLHSFLHPPRLPKGHCKSSSLLDSWRSAFGGGDFFESRLPIIFWFTRNFHTCSFMAILRLFLFSIPTSCMKKSKLRETQWHTQDHGRTTSIFSKEWKLFKSSGFLFFFFQCGQYWLLEFLPEQRLCWTDPVPLPCFYQKVLTIQASKNFLWNLVCESSKFINCW